MQGPDFEPYRGRWIARSVPGDALVADAATRDELCEVLQTLEHPRVMIHRVPTADEPLYISML